MLIEANTPLKVLLPHGYLRLEPGKPVYLPRDKAIKLLSKVPGKVRCVTSLHEAASTSFGANPRPNACATSVLLATEDGWFVVHSPGGGLMWKRGRDPHAEVRERKRSE